MLEVIDSSVIVCWDDKLDHGSNSSNQCQVVAETTHSELCETFAQYFCNGYKESVSEKLLELFTPQSKQTLEEVSKKVKTFYLLIQSADPAKIDHFSVEINYSENDNEYIVIFKIKCLSNIQIEASFNAPSKAIVQKEDLAQFKLKEAAEVLYRLELSKLTDLPANCQCWNKLLHQLQINTEEQATITSTEVDQQNNSEALEDIEQVELSPDEAARKIQKYYRAFKVRRNEKQTTAKMSGCTNEFIKMYHQKGKNDQQTYLIDPLNVFPPIKALPYSSKIVNQQEYGRTKKLTINDGEYVVFQPNMDDIDIFSQNPLTAFQTEKNTNLRKICSSINAALSEKRECGRSFATGLIGIRDRGAIYAASGGESVTDYLSKGKPLPITAFKPACIDLTQLHKHAIFHRDIKSGNFLVKTSYKNLNGDAIPIPPEELVVKYIDIDGAYSDDFGDVMNRVYTPSHTCQKLLSAQRQAGKNLLEAQSKNCKQLLAIRSSELKRILRQADLYSMIITIFMAVTPNSEEVDLTCGKNKPYPIGFFSNGFDQNIGKVNPCKKGISQDARCMFIAFVREHIPNQKLRVLVSKFMNDPIRNPIPDNISLSMIFDWN